MSKPELPGFVLFAIIFAVGAGLKALYEPLNNHFEDRSKGFRNKHRQYGINSQMRRRKLNLLNKNNSFNTSVMSKLSKGSKRFKRKRS